MSKAARIVDSDRTAIMLDLVRQLHEPEHYVQEHSMSLGHVVLEEVSDGTGWSGSRWADVLALGIWRGTGRKLRGYEIKASRADLKKELANPAKHRAVARYCDRWTLVAWDESVLLPGVPEDWGIMHVTDHRDGTYDLRCARKASVLTPEPWTRDFIASMVRNAYEQSAGAAYVARAVTQAKLEAKQEYKRDMEYTLREKLRPLVEQMYGTDSWQWPHEARDPEKLLAVIAAKLAEKSPAQGSLNLEAAS